MLLSAYETRIGDIMETNVLSVNTHEDKEDVAQLFSKYDLSAIPVVDGEDPPGGHHHLRRRHGRHRGGDHRGTSRKMAAIHPLRQALI